MDRDRVWRENSKSRYIGTYRVRVCVSRVCLKKERRFTCGEGGKEKGMTTVLSRLVSPVFGLVPRYSSVSS